MGYGAYIPRKRIRADEIARQWGRDAASIEKGLLLREKSVPGLDEDTITISVAAGRSALDRAGIDPQRVGALYIGSESHPYAVKLSGTSVVEALGIGPRVHVADFEFACKAGTEAMFVALGLVESGRVEYAMGIGADTSQGAPHDALGFSASAGGAAYLFGRDELLADVLETCSYATDTPDFWRREGEFYPRHGGRCTGEPAYCKIDVETSEEHLRAYEGEAEREGVSVETLVGKTVHVLLRELEEEEQDGDCPMLPS